MPSICLIKLLAPSVRGLVSIVHHWQSLCFSHQKETYSLSAPASSFTFFNPASPPDLWDNVGRWVGKWEKILRATFSGLYSPNLIEPMPPLLVAPKETQSDFSSRDVISCSYRAHSRRLRDRGTFPSWPMWFHCPCFPRMLRHFWNLNNNLLFSFPSTVSWMDFDFWVCLLYTSDAADETSTV